MERQELEKQFKDWDTNGDGVLSREEIINGYKKTYGKVDENEIDNMIKSIDLDGNGVIDCNEFLACSMNKEKILRNDNLKICFNEFDTDGSGKISVDEISAIFKRGNKDNEEDLEAFKNMIKEKFHVALAAHGTAVGLASDDDMGNSEVGHLNLGAGRIV